MIRRFALLPALIACSVIAASAQTIAIKSPAAKDTIRGSVSMEADASTLANAAIVEFMLNSKTVLGYSTTPYRLTWNSNNVWDGPALLQAIAFDSAGSELGRSAPLPVTIANGQAQVSLISPDTTKTLSGVIPWTISAKHPDGIGGVTFIVDGNFSVAYQLSMPLDTTKLTNGRHELFNGIYSNGPGVPAVAMLSNQITVDNGHLARELRSQWHTMVMAPGETGSVRAKVAYTDGAVEQLLNGVTYTSTNPDIATVDSDGVVHALAPGLASIDLQANGLKARTGVQVTSSPNFPHLSKHGGLLTEFDPEQSIFVRSVFGLDSWEIDNTPGLEAKVKSSAVNVLTEGLYQNPYDNGASSLAGWKANWLQLWRSKVDTAQRMNVSLYLTGDDIARTTQELNNSISGPWSAEAVQYTLAQARDSGIVAGMDMVDEVNFLWGDTPQPTDGRWQKQSPPIPDTAFKTLMSIVNAVPVRPPISWPVAGLAAPPDVRNWQGDPHFSDYTSMYWTNLDWRWAFPDTGSLPQYRNNMDKAVVDRLPSIQWNKPKLLLTTMTGPFYTKKQQGGQYTPGVDVLQAQGNSPTAISAQILYAVAMGEAGVRVYYLDGQRWKNDRATAPLGSGDQQTGSDPLAVGTDRWAAMSASFNLIQALEKYLLQPVASSPDLGSAIVTGARRGVAGRVFIAVNMSEIQQRELVDLRSFQYPLAPIFAVHHIQGSRRWFESVSSEDQMTLDLAPGEAVIVLFTPVDSPTGRILPPRPKAPATAPGKQ